MKKMQAWLILLFLGASLSLGATLYAGETTLEDADVEVILEELQDEVEGSAEEAGSAEKQALEEPEEPPLEKNEDLTVDLNLSQAVLEQGLGCEQMQNFIKKYAPLVYLHSQDPFRPASFEWYFDRCVVVDGSNTYEPGTITLDQLGAIQTRESYLTPKDKKATYRGQAIVNKNCNAPCYVNIVPYWKPVNDSKRLESLVVQYFFFYPFNGPTIPHTKIGIHEGDWEHIDLYFDVMQDGDTETLKLKGGFYAAHREKIHGKHLSASSIQRFEGTHPIVYSSMHGHPSHPKLFPFINSELDRVDSKGPRWRCWDNLVYLGTKESPSKEAPWIRFAGRCGKGSEAPCMPSYQSTWRTEGVERKLLLSVKMQLSPLSGEKSRASALFSLKNKIPTRIKRLYWKVNHPQASKIEFSVNQQRPTLFIPDKKAVYANLKGSGTETHVSSTQTDLYISRVKRLDPSLDPRTTVELEIWGTEEH